MNENNTLTDAQYKAIELVVSYISFNLMGVIGNFLNDENKLSTQDMSSGYSKIIRAGKISYIAIRRLESIEDNIIKINDNLKIEECKYLVFCVTKGFKKLKEFFSRHIYEGNYMAYKVSFNFKDKQIEYGDLIFRNIER